MIFSSDVVLVIVLLSLITVVIAKDIIGQTINYKCERIEIVQNCRNCLNNTGFSWCNRPGYCFNNTDIDCNKQCIGVVYSNNDRYVDSAMECNNIPSINLVLVLIVSAFCPFCLVIGLAFRFIFFPKRNRYVLPVSGDDYYYGNSPGVPVSAHLRYPMAEVHDQQVIQKDYHTPEVSVHFCGRSRHNSLDTVHASPIAYKPIPVVSSGTNDAIEVLASDENNDEVNNNSSRNNNSIQHDGGDINGSNTENVHTNLEVVRENSSATVNSPSAREVLNNT